MPRNSRQLKTAAGGRSISVGGLTTAVACQTRGWISLLIKLRLLLVSLEDSALFAGGEKGVGGGGKDRLIIFNLVLIVSMRC
jgi:hypothetical protein